MLLLNSAREDIELDENGAVITSEQYVGDDYFDDLQEARDNFAFRLNGFTPVASIPESTVNRWLREGFDFWNAPAKEIVRKLRSESNEGMLITNKTF